MAYRWKHGSTVLLKTKSTLAIKRPFRPQFGNNTNLYSKILIWANFQKAKALGTGKFSKESSGDK